MSEEPFVIANPFFLQQAIEFKPERQSTTAWDCERDGHDWCEGTAVGSLYCPRCRQYYSELKRDV